MPSNWYDPLSLFTAQTVTEISAYLPRLVAALLILVIGAAVARGMKRLVVKGLEMLMVARAIKNTPVELFLKNAEVGAKLEEVLGSIFYWLLMLVVIHTTVAVLGLASLTNVLERVLTYIPNVLSAIIVLFFGVLVAGVVESLIKGSIKSIDGKSARLLGRVASYLVMTISVLAAIKELGIASEFIMVLFVGFVAMLSLGSALALGLGGQDVVRKILSGWYERTAREVHEESKE